jgi:hypothetical protein
MSSGHGPIGNSPCRRCKTGPGCRQAPDGKLAVWPGTGRNCRPTMGYDNYIAPFPLWLRSSVRDKSQVPKYPNTKEDTMKRSVVQENGIS